MDDFALLSMHISYARYFAVSSVPFILNAVFLVALTYKLLYNSSAYPWLIVFVPCISADVWTAFCRRAQVIDCAGSLCTKMGACLYLSGCLPHYVNAVLICLPLWLSVALSTYYRCAFSSKTEFSILVRFFYQLVTRIAQPLLIALQLDGASSDWVVVLTPAWTGLIVCFSGALFLIYCAPVIRMHSLQALQMEATILLFLCCLYLLCISLCGFLFIFWLAEDLDHVDRTGNGFGRHVAVLQIFAPIIALQLILALLQPSISYQSRKFQVSAPCVRKNCTSLL